jgi:hypothetical protein
MAIIGRMEINRVRIIIVRKFLFFFLGGGEGERETITDH